MDIKLKPLRKVITELTEVLTIRKRVEQNYNDALRAKNAKIAQASESEPEANFIMYETRTKELKKATELIYDAKKIIEIYNQF